MSYISAKAYSRIHHISVRWVQELCKSGKIKGATRLNGDGAWMIPDDAPIIPVNNKQHNSSNVKEGVSMVNAEKQMETGQLLLNQGELDMAAVYFEFAGEEFVRRKDYKNAIVAYNKTLYCFETECNQIRINQIKTILNEIKSFSEE